MGGTATISGVELRWSALTDTGRVRQLNEDSVFASAPVFLVADGMGGHSAGDVASSMVVGAFGPLADLCPSRPEEVVRLVDEVNVEIIRAPQDGMGTTAVGLVLLTGSGDPTWMVFNVGDSRCYRLHDGRLDQLTRDHSYVQELVDEGVITRLEALSHPERNVVTRALGMSRDLDVDLWLQAPMPGERFLLCSDGLTGDVAHAAIEDALIRLDFPEEACLELVALANRAGGTDNITAVIVDVVGVGGLGGSEITSPRKQANVEGSSVNHDPKGAFVSVRDTAPEFGGLIDIDDPALSEMHTGSDMEENSDDEVCSTMISEIPPSLSLSVESESGVMDADSSPVPSQAEENEVGTADSVQEEQE